EVSILHCSPDCESDMIRGRFLASVWPGTSGLTIGEPWFEEAILETPGPVDIAACRVTGVEVAENGRVFLETTRAEGRLKGRRFFHRAEGRPPCLTIASEMDPPLPPAWRPQITNVKHYAMPVDGFYRKSEIRSLLAEIKHEIGSSKLSDAEFIIDVGFGVGNR